MEGRVGVGERGGKEEEVVEREMRESDRRKKRLKQIDF